MDGLYNRGVKHGNTTTITRKLRGIYLQSKLPDEEHWTERIEIVQEEEGYRLYAKDVEILVLKASEYISKRKRIVARGLNKDLIYFEEERFDHLWEPSILAWSFSI